MVVNRRVVLAALAALLTIPAAAGESAPPDVYTTHNVNIVGIIPSGSQAWYVYYPTEIDGPGVFQVTVSVDSSAAASTTLTVVPTGTTAVGCTIGTLIVTHSSSSNVAARVPVTVTGEACHATMTLNFQTAAGTVLSGISFGWQMQQHDLEVHDDPDGWHLTTEWDAVMEGFLGVSIGFLIAVLLFVALLAIRMPGFLGKFVGMPVALLAGLLAIASVVQSAAPQAVLFGALFGLVGFVLVGLALWRWVVEHLARKGADDDMSLEIREV